MANDPPKHTKKTPLYQQGNRRYCSATLNLPLDARWFAQTLRDMPKTGFIVWHSLSEFTGYENKINVRLHTIAEFCGISLGSVQRAMQFLEEKEVIVRLSEKYKASVWLVNPELRWTGSHDQKHIMVARFKKRCFEIKQQERAEKKAQLKKNPVTIQIEDNEFIEVEQENFNASEDRRPNHQGAGD